MTPPSWQGTPAPAIGSVGTAGARPQIDGLGSLADGRPVDEVLRRLDLDITRRLDGLLHGDYRGLVAGHGSEPGESRTYQPGDDVRRMDWNVTARTGAPHVRETIADRELETWMLVDLSPSLAWGTAACEKRDLAIAVATGVGLITARTGNRIGAVVHQGGRPLTVPAKSGRKSLMSLMHRLATAPREGGSTVDLAQAIRTLSSTQRRRGLAVVISDFLDDTDWGHALGALAIRHETLAIEVVDPRELDLPDVGLLAVVDTETGERREVNTASESLRRRYREAAADQRAVIAATIRGAGADHLTLRTDGDWLFDLVRFVIRRRERNARQARRTR